MPYEKNKTAYQDEEWFEREQRNVLDVRNWNRDLMGHLPEGKVNKAYDQSERLDERREFLENWGKQLVEMGLKVS